MLIDKQTAESVGNVQKRLLLFDGHALAFHSWFTSYPNEVVPGFLACWRIQLRSTDLHIS